AFLPFRVAYILSDFLYIIMYKIAGYRIKVVRKNLKLAFPHKSSLELLQIEKKFYRHFCDLFIEMIKTTTISQKEMENRFKIVNLDLLVKTELENKSIVLITSHFASYEWCISLNKYMNFQGYAIYKKLANKYFDNLVKKIRKRFGATLITTKETFKVLEDNKLNNRLGTFGFASDQSPMLHRAVHWKKFMGVETPILIGAEVAAKKFDMNVVFLEVKKIKRGYYEANLSRPFENPLEIPDYQITDLFIERLENQINENPEYYFWTHKRWKHTR
ncbi:MAG: lysophospholipid acyltransferase family protein, partial [Flavobacterium sp.]